MAAEDADQLLRAFEYAMAFESVPLVTQDRILNRLIWGDADGPQARRLAGSAYDETEFVPPDVAVSVREVLARAGGALADPPPPWSPFRQPARPDISGFAGPRECHVTAGGIRVHVKPGCRCPRGRR